MSCSNVNSKYLMTNCVGEFTQENQQRLKREDDKPKVDPWKVACCIFSSYFALFI